MLQTYRQQTYRSSDKAGPRGAFAPKKVNIFEIGSLEVYDRGGGGGGLPRVYTVLLRPYMKK